MGSRKFVLTIFFSGREADDQNREQTIGAGTTSEVHSTRLTGGRCEVTCKRIFALRPFAPRRLPSPPLRHGIAFCFSTAYRIQARLTRGAHEIPFPLHSGFKHTLRKAHTTFRFHCEANLQARTMSRRARHGYVLLTQQAALGNCYNSRACIGRLGTTLPILKEPISFSPQCRQSIMMVPARQR